MAEEIFDPLRVLAELNALGVRYVLVGDLAAVPGFPLDADRVEICVADADEDIERLRMLLEALDAEQDGATADPHRAVFRTIAGRIACREMPTDGAFAQLQARATVINFGRGVIANVVAPEGVVASTLGSRDPVGVAGATPLALDRPRLRRSRREDEDEFGPEPAMPPGQHMTPWQRAWKALGDVDDFLSELNERPVRRQRDRRR